MKFDIVRLLFIGYCTILILHQCLELQTYGGESELYYDAFFKLLVYITWILILTIRRSWMWYIGIVFFIIGVCDIYFIDILTGIYRHYMSGRPTFDLRIPFKYITFLKGKVIFRNIGLFFHWIIYPAILIIFLTNPVRRYYGIKSYN